MTTETVTDTATAYARLRAWAQSPGYRGKRTAEVSCRTPSYLYDFGDAPVWTAHANAEVLGFTVDVDAGPSPTPEEAAALLIERLAIAGVEVP